MVDKGSPADGQVAVGDVIVGISGQLAEPNFPDWVKKKKREAVLEAITRIEAATETPTLLNYSDLVKEAVPSGKK